MKMEADSKQNSAA